MNDLVVQQSNKLTTEERRELLLELLKQKGRFNINIPKLAKELGIHKNLLYYDLRVIKEHIDIIDADEVKFELSAIYKHMTSKALKILNDEYSQPMLKLQAMDRLLKINEQHTRFLEDYGLKDAVQRVNMITHEDFQKAYAELKEVKQ